MCVSKQLQSKIFCLFDSPFHKAISFLKLSNQRAHTKYKIQIITILRIERKRGGVVRKKKRGGTHT